MQLQRVFRPCISRHNCPSSLVQKIRIVSYNILADKFKGYNSYCSPEFLDWSYRYPRILQEIQSYKPDILCLQEVEETVYDQQLKPWMQEQGYISLYQPRRTPAEQQGPAEGVSLHYRAAGFTAVAHQTVRFAEADLTAQWLANSSCDRVKAYFATAATGNATNICSSSSSSNGNGAGGCSQHGPCRAHRGEQRFFQVLMQRQEGCVMALLRHKDSQQLLLACSTHLFWNPLFPDVKVAQSAVLCSSVADFIQQHGHNSRDVAVVIGGDFNSTPSKHVSDKWDQVPAGQSLTSGVYQLLQQGQLHPSHHDHPARRTMQASPPTQQQQQQQQPQQQYFAAGLAGKSRPVQQRSQPSAVPASCAQPHPSSPVPVLSSEDSTWPGGHGATIGAAGTYAGNPDTGNSCSMAQHVFNTAGLELASSSHMAHGREPTLTTRTSSYSGCLDYIWLSKQHFHVSETLAMPYPDPDLESKESPDVLVSTSVFGPCPNDVFPSDHLAVGCDAVLLPASVKAADLVALSTTGSSNSRV